MITLVTQSYCEECPMFTPEVDKKSIPNMTEVVCKYRAMCSAIYKHARREKEAESE